MYKRQSLALASNLVTTNNRYNVNAIINAEPKSSNATKLLGLEITGAAGQVIDVYGTNVTFTNNRYVTGSVAGTPAGSINAVSYTHLDVYKRQAQAPAISAL